MAHKYQPGGIAGRCLAPRESIQNPNARLIRCEQVEEHPIHRLYPCRTLGCYAEEFQSIERRDRHEANAHGEGW